MQIQSISVGGGVGSPTVTSQTDNPARQHAQAQISSGFPAMNVGGMQKNAVAGPGQTDKQNATTQEEVDQAAQKINEALQTVSQKLEFSVDKDTDDIVVKVLDKESGDVIRQIPSEELLKIAKALDKLKGLLVKDQA